MVLRNPTIKGKPFLKKAFDNESEFNPIYKRIGEFVIERIDRENKFFAAVNQYSLSQSSVYKKFR